MAKEDKTILRDWRDNFGKSERQLTVRDQSTKDNVGPLPIFAYATPDPLQQPLKFSATVDQTPRLARTENIAPSRAACRTILFQANSVLIVNVITFDVSQGWLPMVPFSLEAFKLTSLRTTMSHVLTFKCMCPYIHTYIHTAFKTA